MPSARSEDGPKRGESSFVSAHEPPPAACRSARNLWLPSLLLLSALAASVKPAPPPLGLQALAPSANRPSSGVGLRAATWTELDLSDAFVPVVLREEPALGPLGSPPYAATYRALAAHGKLAATGATLEPASDLALFGIFPSFSVLQARLMDDARHACDDAVDRAPLSAYSKRLTVEPAGTLRVSEARLAAVSTVQALLRCEGLLPAAHVTGHFDAATAYALRVFQRRHMIVATQPLDDPTRETLLRASLERDFDAVLRALRERVAAATGLIEDGSARGESALVMGRQLDSPALRSVPGYDPLLEGAPDLIGIATNVAATELGWTSASATRDWFRRLPPNALAALKVSLPLPPPPAYHASGMELRVEIDRGDVWYDYPYGPLGSLRAQPVERRPALVLYTRTQDGSEIPLIRWSTTIGGFQPERLHDGRVVLRYKVSEPGARVWREILASPTWLPPDTTPDADLVQRIGAERYRLKREVVGPGYESAYGLVMMRHELSRELSSGELPAYEDHGVRTHGSVSYRSIVDGQSHGCHRLFNHLALRLAAFLLAHRSHVHHGMLPVRYQRWVSYRNVHQLLRVDTRGYGYELTPPVPVVVLPGRIRGHRTEPLTGSLPLPPGLEP